MFILHPLLIQKIIIYLFFKNNNFFKITSLFLYWLFDSAKSIYMDFMWINTVIICYLVKNKKVSDNKQTILKKSLKFELGIVINI